MIIMLREEFMRRGEVWWVAAEGGPQGGGAWPLRCAPRLGARPLKLPPPALGLHSPNSER